MQKLLILCLMAIAIQIQAQNVGIGNPTPAEKLDVTGNINITGTIKANGIDGTAGQLLQNNGNGTLSWINKSQYSNFKAFYKNSLNTDQTWTVPANVNKIMVEAWGGGGGGNQLGGGGGASYYAVIINVAPGNVLTLNVGERGAGAALLGASNGSSTSISINGITALVGGGYGATATSAGPLDGALPSTSFPNYFGIRGQSGKGNNYDYGQTSSANFVKIINYGDGGDAGNAIESGGYGGIKITNSVTVAEDLTSGTSAGINFGGGGGGGILGNGFGGNGAHGLVIVHW
jgi:hypothetical protein